MTDPIPHPSTPPIYRDNKLLLIPKGADLSHHCLVCAEPSVGPPITQHLSGVKWAKRQAVSTGGSSLLMIWDLLAFLLGSIWWVSDSKARQERVVRYGLCLKHRRQYLACRWGAWLGGLAGVPAFIVAFILNSDRNPVLVPILIAIGVAGLFTAYFAPMSAPTLKLQKETPGGLWVRGAGWPFAKLYPEVAKAG